jgi:hypothetical protein
LVRRKRSQSQPPCDRRRDDHLIPSLTPAAGVLFRTVEVKTMMKDLAWFALVGIVLPTIAAALLGRQRHAGDEQQLRADARDVARMDADKG